MIEDHANTQPIPPATGGEDAVPPQGPATPEPDSGEGRNDHGHLGLGPAYALLCAVFGDRMPKGPLGPDTVPAPVLTLPIELATEELVRHSKKCRNPHCVHVPRPLQHYVHMRPAAIRKAREQIYKVLWTHGNHGLVREIRKQILEKNVQLANEVSTGSLLTGNRLAEVLSELGTDAPYFLAAVLWATEFAGPIAEILFRSLVPLVDGETSESEQAGKDVSSDDGQVRSVRAKFRTAIREREHAKRLAKQATEALHSKERSLEKSKGELRDAHREHQELSEVFDLVERRLREKEAACRSLELDAEKAAKVNSALRKDLREMQQERTELEVGRSDLARQLAVEGRRVEHLKLELAGVPRGSDAVMAFLRTEEDRIRRDRMIVSGGARAHADHEWTAYRKLEKAFFEAFPKYREAPPIKIRQKSSLRLIALGGSGEVGRSCYLLELGSHRILVDCGIKPNGRGDLHPDIDRLNRIDALILTHAHTDHIGWVPALVRRFPDLDIYCSEGTAALLPVMLEDCHRHYMRAMGNQRERAQYISNAAIAEEEYDAKDVRSVSQQVITCGFNEEQVLPFRDVSIRFYRAGHILGAASVLIEDQSGRRIFFSGDFSSFPQLTVPAAEWPHDIGDVDLLVLESTYGGREHKPLDDGRRDLLSFIRKTFESDGSVILASFALGRAQELLKLLASARESGDLPTIPVFVDGMIKQINPIYRKHAAFELPPGSFYEVSGETERQEVAVEAQTKPSIIVTTSGMLTGGPAIQYARHLLPDSRHRIVLTGYQDEGAPSRALLEITATVERRVVTLEDERGEPITFEAARPAREVKLSAHADQPGLLEYAGRLRPKHIALVHGEAIAQKELRSHLLRVHPKSEIICGPSEFLVP